VDDYLTGVVFSSHMHISRNQWIIGAVGVVAILSIGILWRFATRVSLPTTTPTATSSEAVSVTATTSPAVVAYQPFPINAKDIPVSWNFKGAYTGNEALIKRTTDDIVHLAGLLGKGEYDDYDLYNGIANDYAMKGDGQEAYQYYNRSIPIHPKKGLAFVNLAHLMDQLGAYYTAADAYTKAVTVEAGMLEYHLERLTFLTQRFPTNNALITAAFADASAQFGDTAATLSIKAEWLTVQRRYTDAIKAWETVKMLSPGKDTSSIDTEIARLQAKQ
jgi:tetratricopeptide (TPR) repeat protein